jgi:hypothetical protein
MRYVIVCSVERLAKALAIQLETKFEVDTLIHTTLEQARGMIDILPDIERLILLKEVPLKDFDFFLSKIDQTSIDLIIPKGQESSSEQSFKRWSEEEEIFSHLSEDSSSSEEEYVKFSVGHLDILDKAPVDYYIMLGEKRKFLKVINCDDADYKSSLKKLDDRKVSDIYVRKEDISTVLASISSVFKGEVDKDRPIDVLKVQEEVYNLMQAVGVSSTSLKHACEYVDEIKDKLNSNQDTKQLLNSVYLKSSNISYQLTYMTALISTKVLESFEWSNTGMKTALINCAYFNDIDIDTKYSLIRSKEELESVEKNLRADILGHALQAANSLKNSKLSELDNTCRVILEHHGDKSGIGFGTDLGKLSKLSGIYILCEEFCCEILRAEKGKVEVGKILTMLKSKYSGDSVEDICQSILSVFKDS